MHHIHIHYYECLLIQWLQAKQTASQYLFILLNRSKWNLSTLVCSYRDHWTAPILFSLTIML